MISRTTVSLKKLREIMNRDLKKRRLKLPRKKRKKPKRRLSVKIRDGRKRIQIGGKKYTLTPVGKRTKKPARQRKRIRRRTPPRDSKGRFRKVRHR